MIEMINLIDEINIISENSCQNFKLAEQMFPCVPMKITENKWGRNILYLYNIIFDISYYITGI